MIYAFWVCLWVLRILYYIFWMKFYFKMWHISMIFLVWETHRLHWSFWFHVLLVDFFFTQIFFPFFFLSILRSFHRKVQQICGDIMGPGSWESIQRPLTTHQTRLPISFGGICLLFMEDCAPFAFLGSWALVAPYLCPSFVSLIDPFWRSMFIRLRGAHTSFCHAFLHDNLPIATKEIHPSFESLVIINALGL
jgi:hypothetical protein